MSCSVILFHEKSHNPKANDTRNETSIMPKKEKLDKKRNNDVETGYICKDCIGIAANVMVPDSSLYNDGIAVLAIDLKKHTGD